MAKDAKGHGSEKRGAFTAKYGVTGGTMASRDAHARVNEFTARSAARQAELRAGGKSAIDAYHQTGEEFKNGPPGGYDHDRTAAAALADGNPKSAAAPVHPAHAGMSALVNTVKKAYGSPEAIKDFTNKYGGPRDHKAEQRGFNSGRREINRLKRQGK